VIDRCLVVACDEPVAGVMAGYSLCYSHTEALDQALIAAGFDGTHIHRWIYEYGQEALAASNAKEGGSDGNGSADGSSL